MPKNRRPGHPKRKLCLNRLKTLKTLPAQTTAPTSPPPPPDVVRRSQRLLEKNHVATILDAQTGAFNAVQTLRQRVFNAVIVVDSITRGQFANQCGDDDDAMENKRRSESDASDMFQPLLRHQWVYKTPEKQRLPQPERPPLTKQVPMGLARLYTTRRQNEAVMVISPIVDEDEVADGDRDFFTGPVQIWAPCTVGPHISVRKRPHDNDPFPPTQSAMEEVSVSGRTSVFASPTMRNLFPFLQPGVTPFPN